MLNNEDIESYDLAALFKQVEKDLMVDLRGDISKTFEASPEHIYKVADKLDKSYEGGIPSKWDLNYALEPNHVFASVEKTYSSDNQFSELNQIALDPSYKVFVNPAKENIEIEISGVFDIDPKEFSYLLDN